MRYLDPVANVCSEQVARPAVTWQASLLTITREPPFLDPGFARARRTALSRGAWVDHVEAWVLRLRPKGGGDSLAFPLHGGDLLVMGGTSQRTWEHCVAKTANAGPRLSVQFRHDV